ncbi:MAG: HAD family hydrolase [Christensenellales bacterium]|jgi:2-haloacid dehalogenase/putative hydrolase of the HAD superfamily
MAVKAIMVDFFGTLVKSDGVRIKDICRQVCETSPLFITPGDVATYWWERLDHYAHTCHGESFRPQRELELRAITDMVEHFESRLAPRDLAQLMLERWRKPEGWHDGRFFMSRIPIPVCVVCNADRADIEAAAEYTQIEIPRIVCSEDARAYKPRHEIFQYALKVMGTTPAETLYVSDSIHYDLRPAAALGIHTAWVNRRGRMIDDFTPDIICDELGALRRMIR